jgi:2-oxoisovalerate dehydrogenase E1 component
LLKAYRSMLIARKVDEKSEVLYKQNKSHFQIACSGHEAIQVATANAMRPGHDWAYPYYRDLAFSTAWGMTAKEHFLIDSKQSR